MALTMFLGGTAEAAKVYGSSIRLNASRTSIHKGQKVAFNGKLNSGFAKCRKHRTVTLYRNGHAIASRTTSSKGNFTFTRRISKTRTWWVAWGGRTGGVHPNQWVCKSSASRHIQVRVTS